MEPSEKGKHAPPPILESAAAQRVAETIAAWDEVNARAHWYLGDERVIDGADFYVGELELGHIHLEAEAHIFLPLEAVTAAVRGNLGQRFTWSRNVLVVPIESRADEKLATWLFRASYDRRRGATAQEIVARIEERAGADRVSRAS
jgi:hypothetical protein